MGPAYLFFLGANSCFRNGLIFWIEKLSPADSFEGADIGWPVANEQTEHQGLKDRRHCACFQAYGRFTLTKNLVATTTHFFVLGAFYSIMFSHAPHSYSEQPLWSSFRAMFRDQLKLK